VTFDAVVPPGYDPAVIAKLKVPIALGLAAAAVVYLVATGVSRNDVYMSSLDEWDPARARVEDVRVVGFVREGSIVEQREQLVTAFVLRNEPGSRSVPVRYAGVLPDLFREGAQLVVSGRVRDDGILHATDLMTKCPSKYEGVEHPPVAPTGAAPVATGAPASTARR
jgi:cytochrome c-type biogenesis protein CcmE